MTDIYFSTSIDERCAIFAQDYISARAGKQDNSQIKCIVVEQIMSNRLMKGAFLVNYDLPIHICVKLEQALAIQPEE